MNASYQMIKQQQGRVVETEVRHLNMPPNTENMTAHGYRPIMPNMWERRVQDGGTVVTERIRF